MIIEIKQQEIARIPLGRRGQPEEVATWVLHVADLNATWFTGQIIGIDGGLDLA